MQGEKVVKGMKTGLLVSLMLTGGIILGGVPIVCFLLVNLIYGIQAITPNLIVIMCCITIVLTFLVAAAIFTGLQYSSCNKVQNVNQIFANAGIAAAIQFVTLLFVHLTGFTNIPKNMLPLWLSSQPAAREGLSYGYFSFFASMFGIVIGGTLSSIC
jgi:hypothetical protein